MLACIERRTREPFNISALRPPSDHIIARRRLQFPHQRRDDIVRGIQIDEGGVYIRLAGEDTSRFAWKPPGTDEAFEGTDRWIARLITANRKTVTGHQPQPRRLPVPAVDGSARRDRRSTRSTRARAEAHHQASVPSNERFPTNTIMPTGGSSGSAAAFAKASRTADSSDNSALITRRVGELNRVANSAASAFVSASSSANSSQLPAGAADVSRPDCVELSTHSVSKIFCCER